MNLFFKTIFFLIIFLLIFNFSGSLNNKSGFLNLTPHRVEAVWWSTVFNQIYDAGVKVVEWIKTHWEDMMRDIVAKRIIDYIVDQTVQWIQGGGKPKFVTNWNSFVKDAGNIAFDSVIREIGAAGLCSPFGLQVKLALLPVQRFSTQISCTLDKVVSNINNFYVDFSVGGWDGYLLSLEPQNNFYGAMLLANDKLVTEIKKSQEKYKEEAKMGNGFLSVTKCKSGTAATDTYGGSEEDLKAIGYVKDTSGNYCGPKDLENTTPGNIVGAAMTSGMDADSKWAANISSWVSALANALINRLLKEGLSELSKSDPNAQPDYYPPEYANIRAGAYEQNKEMMISEVNRAKNNSIGVDTSSIIQETLTYASSTLIMLQEMQFFGCSIGVNEIAMAQSDVDNLSAQSGNNADGASEADLLINDIRATDSSDTAAWSLILDRYNAFMAKDKQNLNDIQNNNSNYDPQGDSQTKLTAAINENNAISARLATCKSPIVINNDDATTTSFNVSLKLNAASNTSGINNATQMTISNDSTFLNVVWETYSTTKVWTLTAGAGLKTVYAQFRDASSTVSSAFSDSIELQ